MKKIPYGISDFILNQGLKIVKVVIVFWGWEMKRWTKTPSAFYNLSVLS